MIRAMALGKLFRPLLCLGKIVVGRKFHPMFGVHRVDHQMKMRMPFDGRQMAFGPMKRIGAKLHRKIMKNPFRNCRPRNGR